MMEFQKAFFCVEFSFELREKVPTEDDRLNESPDNTTIDCHVVSINAEGDVDNPNGEDLGSIDRFAACCQLSVRAFSQGGAVPIKIFGDGAPA